MRFTALAAVAALTLAGCGGSKEPTGPACPDIVLYAVRATISGAADSAIVKITEGAYADSAVLRRTSNPNSMVALLGANRVGTYTLSARSPEYLTQTFNNVAVTGDQCGPLTRIFNIFLQREHLPG